MVRLQEGVNRFARRLDGGLGLRLARLWRNWGEVLGELSEMARPLGRRRNALIIGCEDALVMQELSFFESEVLHRVHEFLGEECFDKVRFELIEDRTSLDTIEAPTVQRGRRPLLRPANLGEVQRLWEDESAIGRSYRAYVALMSGLKSAGGEGER
ncbi:MAG: DUF721 domain-containing protein [Desulfovibrionaceae bacterium]